MSPRRKNPRPAANPISKRNDRNSTSKTVPSLHNTTLFRNDRFKHLNLRDHRPYRTVTQKRRRSVVSPPNHSPQRRNDHRRKKAELGSVSPPAQRRERGGAKKRARTAEHSWAARRWARRGRRAGVVAGGGPDHAAPAARLPCLPRQTQRGRACARPSPMSRQRPETK